MRSAFYRARAGEQQNVAFPTPANRTGACRFLPLYNQAGGLETEIYPSGRQVSTCYSAAGRVKGVGDGPVGSSVSFASGLSYAPDGQIAQAAFGNGTSQANIYNQRLQPTSITVSGPTGTVVGLTYGYGTTNNNGNVQTHGIQPLNVAQTHLYDPLNRLLSSQETGGPGWSETYGYDIYGNRYVPTITGLSISSLTPRLVTNINSATNQLNGTNNGDDPAGNQTTMSPYVFSFDAENRIQAMTSLPNNQFGTATYAYDGDGRRVLKTSSSTTLYVYDAGGDLSAEYSSAAPTQACSACYWATDSLGSVRAVTDQNGNVLSRHDYLPFGEEISTSNRSAALFYGASDSVVERFTGKERDAETGLDFFGARYTSSPQGRFTSPDYGGPLSTPDPVPWADFENPQTLNLYSYGHNSPLSNVDDDGHDVNVCLNDANGNSHCTQMSNEQYDVASQGNGSLNVPTLDQVGMNGNGNGSFNATNITDSSGNSLGTATYVSDGGADYYANRNGITALGQVGATMNDPRTYALWFGASALAGGGLVAAGATSGELTLLGDITLTPTSGEVGYAERLLAQGGKKAVEKAIRTLAKRLAEHQAKVGGLQYPATVQREIATFTRAIEALRSVLR